MNTEAKAETPVAKKSTKRKHKPRNPPRAASFQKPAGELAGLTANDCCKGCNADGCVISGKNYCAHPRKGGLQGADMGDTNAVKRLQTAQKMLGRKAIDERFS